MNNFEAEQLFHRVVRFPASRCNLTTRNPATVVWRPLYLAPPALLEQVDPRKRTGWGRGSTAGISGNGLRKIFA